MSSQIIETTIASGSTRSNDTDNEWRPSLAVFVFLRILEAALLLYGFCVANAGAAAFLIAIQSSFRIEGGEMVLWRNLVLILLIGTAVIFFAVHRLVSRRGSLRKGAVASRPSVCAASSLTAYVIAGLFLCAFVFFVNTTIELEGITGCHSWRLVFMWPRHLSLLLIFGITVMLVCCRLPMKLWMFLAACVMFQAASFCLALWEPAYTGRSSAGETISRFVEPVLCLAFVCFAMTLRLLAKMTHEPASRILAGFTLGAAVSLLSLMSLLWSTLPADVCYCIRVDDWVGGPELHSTWAIALHGAVSISFLATIVCGSAATGEVCRALKRNPVCSTPRHAPTHTVAIAQPLMRVVRNHRVKVAFVFAGAGIIAFSWFMRLCPDLVPMQKTWREFSSIKCSRTTKTGKTEKVFLQPWRCRRELSDGRVILNDFIQGLTCELNPEAKTCDLSAQHADELLRSNAFELLPIRLSANADTLISSGVQQVNGQQAYVYDIADRLTDSIVRIVVDPDSRLPLRMEFRRVGSDEPEAIADAFVFNEAFPSSLISVGPPAGYQTIIKNSRAPMSDRDLEIHANGLGSVHFGMSASQVEQILGKPSDVETIAAGSGQVDDYPFQHLHYKDRGIMVATSNGRVFSIKCYSKRNDVAGGFQGKLEKGPRLWATRDEIEKAYGNPTFGDMTAPRYPFTQYNFTDTSVLDLPASSPLWNDHIGVRDAIFLEFWQPRMTLRLDDGCLSEIDLQE